MTDKAKLYSALIKARAEIPNPTKDKKGHNYMYADLPQIINISVPILAKHGLTVMQPISSEGDQIVVETIIVHGESGEYFSRKCGWPRMQGRAMNEMQAMGSVITYARRYALAAILNIAQEDKDAADLVSVKAQGVKQNTITMAQAAELKALCMKANPDMARLLQKAECRSIDEMHPAKYKDIKSALLMKIKSKEEQQDESNTVSAT